MKQEISYADHFSDNHSFLFPAQIIKSRLKINPKQSTANTRKYILAKS